MVIRSGLTVNVLRSAQPISFHAATLFWTQVAVQHIFVFKMNPELNPTKAAGDTADQPVASPQY